MNHTDGLFTLHKYTIETSLEKPEYIVPVGDIHHDSPCHANHEFDRFLAYMRNERKNAYCLGMGDYLDLDRAHDRALIEAMDAESAKERLNGIAMKELVKLADKLDKLRWIGMLSGNHYANITNRKTKKGFAGVMHSDAALAEMLKAEYLGVCCGLTLTLVDKKVKKCADVHIVLHHGVGSAMTIGGGLNRVRRFISGWEADIALMGHNHQRGILPTEDKISFHNNKLSSRTRYVARTGSFLRGYVDNERSYVTDFALTPASIGWVEFELRLRIGDDGKPTVAIRGIQ